jgi:hypothetical protein
MSVKRVVSIVLIVGVVPLAMVAESTRAMSPGQGADSLGLSHDATALTSQASGAAHAAGCPLGRNFDISNSTSTAAVVPSIAYNSDRDEYLVVWWNDRPGNDDIYGRRVSGDGALIGNWFAIAAGAGHERAFPDVAYNSQAEEYLVVWVDDYSDICAQRVSATGQLQGTEINIGGMGDENWGPAVAYASTENKYLVVWTEKIGTVYAFVGKEVTTTGSPGTRFAIDSNCLNCNEAQADLAYNRPRNEFLVVWHKHVDGDYDVYGRRVKMAGSTGTLGPAFPIFYSVNDEWTPVVAALPGHSGQGQYLVVFQTYIGIGDRWIKGQFVTSDGSLQGSLVEISSSSGATRPARPIKAAVAGSFFTCTTRSLRQRSWATCSIATWAARQVTATAVARFCTIMRLSTVIISSTTLVARGAGWQAAVGAFTCTTRQGLPLLGSYPVTVEYNRSYEIKVVANGSTIEAYLDGRRLLTVTDTTYTSGRLGVMLYQSTATYDDLTAWEIP